MYFISSLHFQANFAFNFCVKLFLFNLNCFQLTKEFAFDAVFDGATEQVLSTQQPLSSACH